MCASLSIRQALDTPDAPATTSTAPGLSGLTAWIISDGVVGHLAITTWRGGSAGSPVRNQARADSGLWPLLVSVGACPAVFGIWSSAPSVQSALARICVLRGTVHRALYSRRCAARAKAVPSLWPFRIRSRAWARPI